MRMFGICSVFRERDMAQHAHQDIQDEAIAWHIRLRDGGAADWDAFVGWLEADPARSAAYDAVALADAALASEAVPPPAANDDREGGRWSAGRRWATALAAAAALFLLGLIAIPWLIAGPDRYEVATAAGQHRTAPLGDGGSVQLNGATRLVLDRNDPRYAELVTGEATFAVRHDAAHPFVVVAGDHRVQDSGTTFNLVRDRSRFSVAVIEGSVVYDPDGAAVPLAAGQTLHADQAGRPVVGREDPQAMTGWQRGQLSYRAAPLEIVAGDLSRSLGVEVAIDPELAALPFTGSIRVDRDAVTSLASTLGLQARQIENRWLIEPHSRARR
jgi:transmembrane sensor